MDDLVFINDLLSDIYSSTNDIFQILSILCGLVIALIFWVVFKNAV